MIYCAGEFSALLPLEAAGTPSASSSRSRARRMASSYATADVAVQPPLPRARQRFRPYAASGGGHVGWGKYAHRHARRVDAHALGQRLVHAGPGLAH